MPEGVRKGTLYTLIGLGASGLLLFLFNMLAARMLGPSGFGILSVVYSLISATTPLLVGGISTGIVRFVSAFEAQKEKGKIQGTVRDGFILWICFFLLFLIVTSILRDSIRVKYLDGSSFLFVVFVLGVLFHSSLILICSILKGLREFRHNAVTIIAQYSFRVLFLLGFVIFLDSGINGASATLFSAPLVSLIIAILICFKLKGRLASGKPEGDLKGFFNFAGPVTLSSFLAIFLLRCGPLLIKTLGGIEANRSAGLFASVFALVSVGRMAVSALGTVLFPNLSRANALGNIELQKRYIRKSFFLMSGLCVLMIIGLWLFGPIIMKIVYGKEFVLRRLDILLIATMGGFFFLAQLLNSILLARSLTKEVLISWGSALLFLVLFIWITELSPLLRVEAGLCLATFTAFSLMLGMLRAKRLSTPSNSG